MGVLTMRGSVRARALQFKVYKNLLGVKMNDPVEGRSFERARGREPSPSRATVIIGNPGLPVPAPDSGFLAHARHARGNDKREWAGVEGPLGRVWWRGNESAH